MRLIFFGYFRFRTKIRRRRFHSERLDSEQPKEAALFSVKLEAPMSEVVYRSHVRIERMKGPVRKAYLPAESNPVIFGVHGAVAEHYRVPAAVFEPTRPR
jgi:hypothetical protein